MKLKELLREEIQEKHRLAQKAEELLENATLTSILAVVDESLEGTVTSVFCSAGGSGDMHLWVTLPGLESFKAPSLTRVIEAIESIPMQFKVESHDLPQMYEREFRYEFTGLITIFICARIRSTSPLCRRVQTGVKEVPLFKMECD